MKTIKGRAALLKYWGWDNVSVKNIAANSSHVLFAQKQVHAQVKKSCRSFAQMCDELQKEPGILAIMDMLNIQADTMTEMQYVHVFTEWHLAFEKSVHREPTQACCFSSATRQPT